MADPIWTYQYNFTNLPEAQGFTRRTHVGTPGITFVTTGNPAQRRIEIDSTNGDAVFLTSTVPSLDSTLGATAELTLNVSGNPDGDAGFELTFLDHAFGINIFPSHILIDVPGLDVIDVLTASNAVDIIWRITYVANTLALYRAGVLVAGPIIVPAHNRPFQRFLFWCEGGAICVIRGVKFFVGGAVAP